MNRLLILILGNTLMALGTSICNLTGLGIDPFNAFSVAISTIFNISLGTVVLLSQLFFGLFIFIFKRENIGIGTIIPMVILGYLFQFFNWLIPNTLAINLNLITSPIIFIVGLLIMAFGTAVYMKCNVGMLPYDSVAFVLSEKLNGRPAKYRVILDSLVAIFALILGGPINVGTAIFAVSMGPLIDFYHQKVLFKMFKSN